MLIRVLEEQLFLTGSCVNSFYKPWTICENGLGLREQRAESRFKTCGEILWRLTGFHRDGVADANHHCAWPEPALLALLDLTETHHGHRQHFRGGFARQQADAQLKRAERCIRRAASFRKRITDMPWSIAAPACAKLRRKPAPCGSGKTLKSAVTSQYASGVSGRNNA